MGIEPFHQGETEPNLKRKASFPFHRRGVIVAFILFGGISVYLSIHLDLLRWPWRRYVPLPIEAVPENGLLVSESLSRVHLLQTVKVDSLTRSDDDFLNEDERGTFLGHEMFACLRSVHSERQKKVDLAMLSLGKGEFKRQLIPELAGFMPNDLPEDKVFRPLVRANPRGDLLLWWADEKGTLLAMLRKDASEWAVKRVKLEVTTNRVVVPSPDGAWYLLSWRANYYQGFKLSIYGVDTALNVSLLGTQEGPGHHATRTVEACFSSQHVLQVIWAEVTPGGNRLRILASQLNVVDRRWANTQVLFEDEQFVSWASPAVLVSTDNVVHYLWTIGKESLPGLYYRREGGTKIYQISTSEDGFKAMTLGDRIVVCYTLESARDKVFFRVIEGGIPGPQTEIIITNQSKSNLWGNNLIIGAGDKNRFWFVSTVNPQDFYELGVDVAASAIDRGGR